MTAPELMASMDMDGTTTIVCGSWLKRSIDFHSGTSFFWSWSNSAWESVAVFRSDIGEDLGFCPSERNYKPYRSAVAGIGNRLL